MIDQLRVLLRSPEIVVATWRATRETIPDLSEAEVKRLSTSSMPSGMSSSRRSKPGLSSCSSSGWMSIRGIEHPAPNRRAWRTSTRSSRLQPAEGRVTDQPVILSADAGSLTVRVPLRVHGRAAES